MSKQNGNAKSCSVPSDGVAQITPLLLKNLKLLTEKNIFFHSKIEKTKLVYAF